MAKPNTDIKITAKNWNQPHNILLIIILIQGCFMIFMSLQGPSASRSHAQLAPQGRVEELASRLGRRGQTRNEGLSLGGAKKPSLEELKKRAKASAKNKKKKNKIFAFTHPPQYKKMLQVNEWEVNQNDFPGALHFHFAEERQEPSFRRDDKSNNKRSNKKWEDYEKEAHEKLIKKDKVLHSCQYYSPDTGQILFDKECFEKRRKNNRGLIVYNSQPFTRTWCGKPFPPQTIKNFDKLTCNETEIPRVLLPSYDKLLQAGMRKDIKKLAPPVFKREGAPETAKVGPVQDCDVPCMFTMDTCQDSAGAAQKGESCLPDVSDWTVEGTDFKFRYSMKDPRDAADIAISRKAYREHQYYATRSFQSEIPLSYFDWDRYGELKSTKENDYEKSGEKGMCFIHLEPCQGEIRPGPWVGKLHEAFKGNFDSYGPCKFSGLKEKETSLQLDNYQDRQSIMGEYMFTLVIGYSSTPDMVTPLIWDALAAGSIPVYHGIPNIREHAPPNSIIVASEYPTREALALYLEEVKGSKEKWESFHAWRNEKTESPFEEKYSFLKEKSSSAFCRMCRWTIAAQYSLSWDPKKQGLVPYSFDRKFCTTKDVVVTPFSEVWMSNEGLQDVKGKRDCIKNVATQTISFNEIAITRTVTFHDNGVIDMVITDIQSRLDKETILLRLDFKQAIQNVDGAHIAQPHQLVTMYDDTKSDHIPLMSSIAIQDEKSKATILSNWVTDVRTPKSEGKVDILIKDLRKSGSPSLGEADPVTGFSPRLPPDEVLRIRVIIEDVNLLRDASTEYSVSPYARLMITDFLDPMVFLKAE